MQIPSERLKWFSQEKSVPGLELYDKREAVGAVGALKAGAGPLNVYANYHGQESNRVAFKSVEADPNVKLDIDVDRTLRIAGEAGPGRAHGQRSQRRRGTGALAHLVQEFQRQSAEGRGKDRTVRHRHPGRCHGDRQPPGGQGTGQEGVPRLRSGQGEAGVRPGQRSRAGQSEGGACRCSWWKWKPDGKKEKQRAELLGQGVGYYVAQPKAVRFYPPILTGLKPGGAV